jgi:hypothetical protein
MQTGHQNSHNIKSVKLCLHIPWSGMQMEQKVQGAFPYYLIAVHEEAAMNVHMHS